MATDTLPEEGELRLGAVMLPPGRRIVPQEGPGEPVAWVTTQPVPDPGRVWSALSDAHLETGLVPIVLTDGEKDEDFFFSAPDDLAELDHLDAASVLGIGLAPAEDGKLSMAECQQVLGSLPPAPIGLVPASPPTCCPRLAGAPLTGSRPRSRSRRSCAPGRQGSGPGSWTWVPGPRYGCWSKGRRAAPKPPSA